MCYEMASGDVNNSKVLFVAVTIVFAVVIAIGIAVTVVVIIATVSAVT